MSQKVSGGFNPKYPGLAQFRMALKMNEAQFEKHIEGLLGKAAVEAVQGREKDAAMRRQLAELQGVMAFLKKTYPREYAAVMAERQQAKRFKALTAKPGGLRMDDDDALARREMALRRRK